MSQGPDAALFAGALFKRRSAAAATGKLKHSLSVSTSIGPPPDTPPALRMYRSEGIAMASPPADSPTSLSDHDATDIPAVGVVAAAPKSDPFAFVKYGDIIRLCAKLPEGDEWGTVGTYDMDATRQNLTLHKCDSLVCVAPPSEPHFKPSFFRVLPECYYAHLKLGSPVAYGAVVVLLDMENKVWNNKIGFEFNGHFAPAEKLNRSGDMTIAFLQRADQVYNSIDDETDHLDGDHATRFLCYGDENVLIQVVDSNRLRLGFNQILTSFRKKNTPIQHGGFLRCDGKGTMLRVHIQGLPSPQIDAVALYIHDGERDNVVPIAVPDHSDITGLKLTLTGPRRSRVHFDLKDNLGSLELTFDTMARAHGQPWDVVTQQGQRHVHLTVQATLLPSTEPEPPSPHSLIGLVLVLVALYAGAIGAGAIAATNMYGTLLLWAKPVLPLAWVAKVVWDRMRRKHDEPLLIALTILEWEVETADARVEKDGSTTHADDADTAIPRAFIVAEMGNVAKAELRYNDTLTWRREHHMDDVLSTKQMHFHTIRRYYKQCIHKRDKIGHPVYIEKLGNIDLKALAANGVHLSEMFKHYLFNIEYIFNRIADELCPCMSCKDSNNQKLLIILDARGIGMRDLAGEVLEFVRSCTSVMQKHYPQRSFKIFFVNVPSWFGIIWKLVKPLLNETTRAKTQFLSEAETAAALLQVIDAANLPEEYGGTCSCAGGCFEGSEFQLAQEQFVDQLLAGDDSDPPASTISNSSPRAEVCVEENEHSDDDTSPSSPDEAKQKLIKLPSKTGVMHSGFLLMRLIRHKHFVNPIWLRRLVSITRTFTMFGDYHTHAVVAHDVIVQKSSKDTQVKYPLTHGAFVRVVDKPNCFEVVMEGHSLLFYAETVELRAEWIAAFELVVSPSIAAA
ncbi:Aste57867_21851 [Aphanomyces stellatus]|uniref:Aste57867_21851 protein n=1 Tax=Aphanomyces stellatus TaxID=120398 RepID=A0A485LJZ9_9STRA|nr:hypothetical protein As57867_021782 [Aphanomyces stellatus]VFT98520.1 Aste57867_21851 [Aphanomyces stellatus]